MSESEYSLTFSTRNIHITTESDFARAGFDRANPGPPERMTDFPVWGSTEGPRNCDLADQGKLFARDAKGRNIGFLTFGTRWADKKIG
jgi:hypothetical protein